MPTYIMFPNMFYSLSSIRGFSHMNGGTYTEHICIIFDSQLTEEQKKKIKSMNKFPQRALDYLGTIVKYTHEYS